MKYQCEHSDTGLCLSCSKLNDQINKAYDLLWEVFAKVREEEWFEVSTLDTEENDVVVSCDVKKLKDILNAIDCMLER
jgi:hypothetical protein